MTEKTGFNHSDGVSLLKYLEEQIGSLDRKVDMRYEMQKIALDKAEGINKERLDGMNEWRATVTDLTSRFVTLKELDLKLEALNKGRKDTLALIMALISFAIMLWKFFT